MATFAIKELVLKDKGRRVIYQLYDCVKGGYPY